MPSKKLNALFLCGLFFVSFLIGCSNNSPDAVFNRGLRAMSEKDAIGASLYFDEFILKFPNDERAKEAHWYLVSCYDATKDYSSSRNILEQIKKKYTDPIDTFNADFGIAKTFFDEGAYDKSIPAFQTIAASTDTPKVLIEANRWTAASYSKLTQTATAALFLEKVYKTAEEKITDPTESFEYRFNALVNTADIYNTSEMFDKSRAVYQKAVNLVNSVTGILNLEDAKEEMTINQVNTYMWAKDFITCATMYDQLHSNPNIREKTKPYLITWKISALMRLFATQGDKDKKSFTPEETAVLVSEFRRLTDGYSTTDAGIDSNVEIARLVKDSTPEMSTQYLNKAVEAYKKMITEPSDPQKPLIAMFRMADAYIKMDKLEDAKQTLKKIQTTYSNIPKATEQSNRILSFIKKMEEEKAIKATQGAAVKSATETIKTETK